MCFTELKASELLLLCCRLRCLLSHVFWPTVSSCLTPHPWFVILVHLNPFTNNGIVHAIDAWQYRKSLHLQVYLMDKYIPSFLFKTVMELRENFLRPNFNCPAGQLKTVSKGFVCWSKKQRGMVWLSKALADYGPLSVPYVPIDITLCVFPPACAINRWDCCT